MGFNVSYSKKLLSDTFMECIVSYIRQDKDQYLRVIFSLAFATDSTGHLVKADWFVGMLLAIAFVLVIVFLVCVVKRNRGGKYAVHKKEIEQGRGLDFDHEGFDEYTKP